MASELKDQNSILNFYARLLALRHQEPALLDGEYVAVNEDDPNVLSYLRRYKDESVLVVLNMSARKQEAAFNLAAQGFSGAKATTMLTTMKKCPKDVSVSSITLEPFGVYIGKIAK